MANDTQGSVCVVEAEYQCTGLKFKVTIVPTVDSEGYACKVEMDDFLVGWVFAPAPFDYKCQPEMNWVLAKAMNLPTDDAYERRAMAQGWPG